MVTFGFIMVLELHRQGLKAAAIARQPGIARKTVRKYISRGLEPPTYGPRPHRQKSTDPFLRYLRERLVAFPGLTAVRLWREMRERGYAGGYTAVKRAVRDTRICSRFCAATLPRSRRLAAYRARFSTTA